MNISYFYQLYASTVSKYIAHMFKGDACMYKLSTYNI